MSTTPDTTSGPMLPVRVDTIKKKWLIGLALIVVAVVAESRL